MFLNGDELPAGAAMRGKICIVGSGPAGITLAMTLARYGHDIILLESGTEGKFTDQLRQLNEGEVADPALHCPADRYRQRGFGGSSAIWGGRCMPFDPIDFERRSWIPHSGWPIGYDQVARHYPEANRLVEAGEFEYDARKALPGGMRPVIPRFDPAHFDTNQIERFSCPTHFGARYRARLDAVRVITNATVTHIAADPSDGRIRHVVVRNSAGGGLIVQADVFVLATGGIETPRMLLNARDVHTGGIGNDRDLVGRFYMCHIAGTAGCLRPGTAGLWHGYDVAPDGTYCRRRLALRPAEQVRHQIGNVIFRPHHRHIGDPSHRTGSLSALYLGRRLISYEYAKRLAGDTPPGPGVLARHALNLMTDLPATTRFFSHLAWRRMLAERKFPSVIVHPRDNLFSLDVHAEQVPNPDSRVGLGDGVDRFGNRQVRIDWRYTGLDMETVRRAFGLLGDDLRTAHAGELWLPEDEIDLEAAMLRDGAYGGHHIGTARMGGSATSGVVDADCKVFGVNNLYIAGSAVFPTSSQANPTLTIVAMALRLADTLRDRMANTRNVAADPVQAGV